MNANRVAPHADSKGSERLPFFPVFAALALTACGTLQPQTSPLSVDASFPNRTVGEVRDAAVARCTAKEMNLDLATETTVSCSRQFDNAPKARIAGFLVGPIAQTPYSHVQYVIYSAGGVTHITAREWMDGKDIDRTDLNSPQDRENLKRALAEMGGEL
jgi:hypothetical protein